MAWMLLPFKRYFEFSGRSRRKEYWMFVLFTVIGSVVLGALDAGLGLNFGEAEGQFGTESGVLGSIFSLATLIPSITVAVRRLHDTNRSGLWLLVLLATVIVVVVLGIGGNPARMGLDVLLAGIMVFVAGVVLLVFFCLDGTRGPNRYGDDPKGAHFEGVFE